MGRWQDERWVWNIGWRRRLYVWELDDAESLNLRIAQISPRPQARDDVGWKGNTANAFPIREIGAQIHASAAPILPKEITNLMWKIKVPPRAHLVIWLANLEKLKTGDILINRGLIDPSLGKCPFCENAIESNSHLLFTCNFSWKIWMEVLNWWGVSGVLQDRCTSFFIAWRFLVPKRCRGKLWPLVLGCVLWSLWFERNSIKFNNGAKDYGKLVYTIKVRVGLWAKEMLGMDISSFQASTNNMIDYFYY